MGLSARFTGLWLHSEFRRLWGGQASSLFASQLMFLALPLTAVSVLDATPFQMGVVTAMAGLPALIGLYMGSWVDRRRRLPVIVAADVGRALLLAVIPVAHIFDVLTIEIIYAVSFGVGAMSILFQIAYRSFLPSVVKQEELVEANSKLEFATSGAGSLGPAIGGGLVQLRSRCFSVPVCTRCLPCCSDESASVNVNRTATAPIPKAGSKKVGGFSEATRFLLVWG